MEFLEILKEAWDKAITLLNIKKAWKAVGLEPYNLKVVMQQLLEQLRAQPATPPLTVTQIGLIGEAVQVPVTPSNIAQVDKLFQRIIEGEHQLDPAIVLQI